MAIVEEYKISYPELTLLLIERLNLDNTYDDWTYKTISDINGVILTRTREEVV